MNIYIYTHTPVEIYICKTTSVINTQNIVITPQISSFLFAVCSSIHSLNQANIDLLSVPIDWPTFLD